jgi:hypothetical protein
MTTTPPLLHHAAAAELARLNHQPHDPQRLKIVWNAQPGLCDYFQSERQFLAWHANKHRAMHLGSDRNVEKLAGGLAVMGYRNVQGTYFLGLEEGASAWARRIAEQTTSDQPIEVHRWLGSVGSPSKFTGERTRRSLTSYGIQVVSDKYELTADADIDDVRRDKTGQVLRRVGEMGRKTAGFDEKMLADLIESTATCYDGVALWSASHRIGNTGGTQSNDITASGMGTPDAPNSAGMSSAILAGIKQLYAMLDDRGDPMNVDAKRFVLLAPVKYWDAIIAALRNDFTSAGVSNTLPSAGLSISPFVTPRLKGTNDAAGRRIYLFREDAGVLPFVVQNEEIPDAFKSQDAYSDSGFWQDRVAWGSKRITAVAPGRFELACRVNLAT